MTEQHFSGAGTAADPWILKTAPLSSSYTAFIDSTVEPQLLVCQVGSTKLAYLARGLDDLHAELVRVGDWVALAALGILCTGVAYLMYFGLIQEIGPTRALSVTFLIPVFGVLWGALFLHEPIGWDKLTGGILVLAGISLTTGLVKLPQWEHS